MTTSIGPVADPIKQALAILTGAGVLRQDACVIFADDEMQHVEVLLDTALEADACRRALDSGITFESEISVQELVDELDETPHRFVLRYLAAVERVRQLEDRLASIEQRLLLYPLPRSAA